MKRLLFIIIITHSHTHSLTYILTHIHTHSLTYTLTRIHTHSLTHLYTHSLTYINTHSLTYSLTHIHTHSLTHSHTHSMQLNCHSVAVVLTLVQTKQMRINIHKRNNTKYSTNNKKHGKQKYTYYQNTKHTHIHTLQSKLQQPQCKIHNK